MPKLLLSDAFGCALFLMPLMSPASNHQTESPPAAELVRVESLRIHFTLYNGQLRRRESGIVRAVDGVSFTLRQGETLALVGAARCGKTTVARAVGLLQRPTAGRILFRGRDLATWRGRPFKRARRRIQMLFSNPYAAFAPRMRVEEILGEALDLGEGGSRQGRDERLAELMTQVGLNLYLALRFPRDLSAGQRQRLAVARALATGPALLICDQPTDYVEPAAGETIVDLLHELGQRLGLTTLLTARELDVARHADRVAVMVLGRIVEMGTYGDLIRRPLHPFTQALLRAPARDYGHTAGRSLDPLHPATGCHYGPLCPLVEARCRARYPPFVQGGPNHGVACHLVDPV